MTMYNTLLLDQTAWDLVIDSAGNIAMGAPPYAVAQDVASACRTFQGEVYYDTARGVPYFAQILGKLPPVSLLTALEEREALTVPGVVSARCILTQFQGRQVNGQIQFIDETGAANAVGF